MEVVDSWKREHCCEVNTRFHADGFLETNTVQNTIRVNENSTKTSVDTNKQQTFPWIPPDYINGLSDENAFNPVWRWGRIPLP
jgi:hypothetical protein